ncbi:nuclear transport factor 2 family protein [Sphingobacterium lactis]|uniref:nuclear transport factor 2 family protein n=1 Tax=Sphingobacterium lactis TaxID=797291 RepID=UPI003EC4B628
MKDKAAIMILLGLMGAVEGKSQDHQINNRQVLDQKTTVINLLKSFESGNTESLNSIHPNTYKQHNLQVADGYEGFKDFFNSIPHEKTKVQTIRVFQDGAYVFTHTDYDLFGQSIGFDIFRFADGKIVEHWDNLQEKPAKPNPSGRSMIDGTTVVQDLDKTDTNKHLVRSFVEEILVKGNLDKIQDYFEGDNYLQHNPIIPDQISGLNQSLATMAEKGITMEYDKIHLVLGEGNFVLVVSEGKLANIHTSFYDLFRVENGKIAEHWDTIETIPAEEHWKNMNGKF